MSVEEEFDFDVFISYSSKDKEWVRGELLKGLEDAGIKVFVDYRDFSRGAPSIKECERGVVKSGKTLLILTPNYIESEWGELENVMVQTLDPANATLRLIPLLKCECKKPLRIATLTHIDFTDDADQDLAWQQLLTALGGPTNQKPPNRRTPAEIRWQYINLTLAFVFVLLATIWTYRVLGVFAVSVIWAGLSAAGVSGIVGFFFPRLGFRERIRQTLKRFRRQGTAVVLAIMLVVGGLMSVTGTTIIVLSVPDGATQIQIEWGDPAMTSQDELKVNQPKWFWTSPLGTKVRVLSPGFVSVTRDVTPWAQLRIHGKDDLKHSPFVVVRIGKPLPPSVPARDDGADFQWSLRVTIRSVANPTAPVTIWQPSESYYVGDPIWLGGDGTGWPGPESWPKGMELDKIIAPEENPCVLTAENDYTIELLDQNQDVQFTLDLSHEDIARIRNPELREFVKP